MKTLNADIGRTQGRVFSYVRWSTERQNFGDSERRQEQAAKDWCARRGLQLAETSFADRGVSAFTGKNRKEGALGELLKIVQSGDIVLVEDQDRFSREPVTKSLPELERVVSKGVKLIFIKTNTEVTADNFHDPSTLYVNFFQFALANAENRKKAERVKASWDARKQAVKEGKPLNQNLPSWLRWDRESKTVLVREDKAAVVRRMFNLYLEGNSLGGVAAQLIKEGATHVSRKKSTGWGSSYVHRTLTNAAVIGTCLGVPKVYPAVIDEKTFGLVVARLKERQRVTSPGVRVDDNLFVSLLVCSRCGGALNRFRQHRNNKVYRYYVCSNARDHRGCTCKLASIREDLFEAAFSFAMTHNFPVRRYLAEESGPSRLEVLQDELNAVQDRLNNLMGALEGDDNPARRVLDMVKNLEAKEIELQTQVETESGRVQVRASPMVAYEKLAALDLRNAEHRLEMKELVRQIVQKITVELGEHHAIIQFKSGMTLPLTWGKAGFWTMFDAAIAP